jgi:MFS family permease
VAFYVLGSGIGPLFLASCSELYGKRVVYLLSFACFAVLNVACGFAPNIAVLTVLRFLSGVAGAVGPSLSSGSSGDLFCVKERGRAQAIVSIGPVFGPGTGGLIGAFLVYGTSGWRWLLWTVAIAAGAVSCLSFCFLKESYGPFILAQKAKRLNKTTTGIRYYVHENAPLKNVFGRSITRPVRLLFTSPMLGFMALYQSL